jgi:hypothetical protein
MRAADGPRDTDPDRDLLVRQINGGGPQDNFLNEAATMDYVN